MALSGPIVLIEDDQVDRMLFLDMMKELGVPNEVKIFPMAEPAHEYLLTTADRPFIIICDVNLPRQSGLDFKEQIDNDPYLRKKSIPFIFYSTSVRQKDVDRAYINMTVQGYFPKATNYDDALKHWQLIIAYWKSCYHPNV